MQSGTYVPKLDVEVTSWPLPDANGDGDPVLDDNGGEVKDQGGNVVKAYDMPTGYVDLHGDGAGVKVDRKGSPVRDSGGNAIVLQEGGAIAAFPDGSVQSLDPDACVLFTKAYALKASAEPAPAPAPTEPPPAPTEPPPAPDTTDNGNGGDPATDNPAPTS